MNDPRLEAAYARRGTGTLPSNARQTDPIEAARFMAAYAKRYSAGAFAMPLAADIAKAQANGQWLETEGLMGIRRRLARDSIRRDFTGRPYTLTAGSTVITHLAAEPDAGLPALDDVDTIYSYIEDANLTRQMLLAERLPKAMRVSAASELIAAWGPFREGFGYPEPEDATIRRLPLTVGHPARTHIEAEAKALTGWTDDFPFYSDGSWSALNLRGFRPDDPTWGIKPAEMSKAWKAEHPEAAGYRCDWTVLAERTPAIRELVEAVFGHLQLERVRLLQMAARPGKVGKLSRHTDVTDKAAGVADGKIARFHIPLITHPSITMTAWNLSGRHAAVHLPPWSMWYLDARKPHAVVNPSDVNRIHLVVDVVSTSAVRQAIVQGVEHVR